MSDCVNDRASEEAALVRQWGGGGGGGVSASTGPGSVPNISRPVLELRCDTGVAQPMMDYSHCTGTHAKLMCI